jgi:hypothetical protein
MADQQVERIIRTVKAWNPESPPSGTYQKWALALVNEIERLRRGEFICSRCGIRKDGEKIDVEF